MIEINATFLVCMISFIVFMLIMNAIFYRPMLEMMRKREGYINKNYDDAKDLSSKAQNCTTEYNTKLSSAKETGKKQAAHAIDSVQRQSFDKIKQAKDSSKVQIEAKKNLLQKEKEDLKNTISAGIENDLAAAVTSKLLNGNS